MNAMTEKEFKEICLCGETTRVQFKREFTTQKEMAKEMIAFANSRGGMILFGVEDKTGELVGLLMNNSSKRLVSWEMPHRSRFALPSTSKPMW